MSSLKPCLARSVSSSSKRQAAPRNLEYQEELILCALLNIERHSLYTEEHLMSDAQMLEFQCRVKELKDGRPLQYILGDCEFYGLKFKVTEGVFIPRPETEILIDTCLTMINAIRNTQYEIRILDLGTGSGNIAISLTKNISNCKITACDISDFTLRKAQENAVLWGSEKRIEFVKSNLFEGLVDRKFDMVISNPPYIPSGMIDGLPADVRRQPKEAIDGGRDGLSFYKKIAPKASSYLRKGGLLIMELGDGQMESVVKLLGRSGFSGIQRVRDYNNIERVVVAKNLHNQIYG